MAEITGHGEVDAPAAAGSPPQAQDTSTPRQSPRLTVGIPTYNRAEWLAQALDSVLTQSFGDFKVIVGDNASDDDTESFMRSVTDPRVEYVRSEVNVGSMRNINNLISLADTEYLLLLPDDDVLYPGHLRASMAILDTHPSVGAVHSAHNRIDASSRVIARVDPVSCRASSTLEPSDRALERLMHSSVGLCFCSVVYRTQAVVAAGGLHEELGPFCDRELWMQLALEWDFGYLATPFVGQRAHPGTTTQVIATEQGLDPASREQARLYADMNFQRRVDFLSRAQIEPSRARRLRGIAELQRLVEYAHTGLPPKEVATRLVDIVRRSPQLLWRPALWRLVAAELGGRRVRAAVHRLQARFRGSE
jgi:glycosyltransferase involved in cell wall biosynthesis